MLESYTTLGYLAGVTSDVRLGVLVTGVTYRNVAHLAKIVATLDVLSGGRAWCGLGAAWFAKEHQAYGWAFPSLRERYALLEDALRLLPVMWGAGSPPFEGAVVQVPETTCYPRPLQERVPIMVGGSGERRTLRLVAEHADACNLFGDAATVRHKVDVLHRHCADVGRDPDTVLVTHLSTALTARSRADLDAAVAAAKPKRATPEAYAAAVNAGTVDDHVGRFRELADAGVQTAIVNLPDLGDVAPVERFAEIIARFRVDG
jgi:alkanesulfonate monooxygenase SsuD/methylene tetrahydromethanopterin reductase-like flavin-dependent oxidoreductase (luciferase family)